MNDPSEAVRLMELAHELSSEGRLADAEGAFRAATEASPEWSVPWYELGLLCKYQGRWAESLEFNRRAAELEPTDEASWWNLGIAATAVGDWPEARRAWAECGIELPPGEGPPQANFGLVPIRLDPDERGEVVWAHRIDPARARIRSVPLPGSPYRFDDLVLHDGAAEGYRMLKKRKVPVFNVLERLEPSEFVTFIVKLGSVDGSADSVDPASVGRLAEIAHELGGAAEDWGTSTRILCRECSLGLPHEHDDRPGEQAHPHCGVAARDEGHAQTILERWLAATPGADLLDWGPDSGEDEQS